MSDALVRATGKLTRRLPATGVEQVLRRLYPPERPRKGVEATFPIGDRLVFRANTASFIEWRIFFFGGYEPEVAAFLPHALRPGRSAVDVGAHAGIHTVRMARLAAPGLVVACEPNPSTFERLARNIELNGLTNIRACQLALLDVERDGALYVPRPGFESNEGASTLSRHLTDSPRVTSVQVQATTLDELTASLGVEDIDVLKIDVEGFEAAVLAGARAVLERDQPTLIFECTPSLWEAEGFCLSSLTSYLRSLGYATDPLSLTPGGLVPAAEGLPRFKNLVVLAPRLARERGDAP